MTTRACILALAALAVASITALGSAAALADDTAVQASILGKAGETLAELTTAPDDTEQASYASAELQQ
jgi:hypothetical protein